MSIKYGRKTTRTPARRGRVTFIARNGERKRKILFIVRGLKKQKRRLMSFYHLILELKSLKTPMEELV